jgi:hypothetical protein
MDSYGKSSMKQFILTADFQSWGNWKHQTTAFAFIKRAGRILSGEETTPIPHFNATEEELAALESWERRNIWLYEYLHKTIGPENIGLIRNIPAGDSAGIYTVLLDDFESSTVTALKQRVSKLVNLKMRSNNVINFIEMIRTEATIIVEPSNDLRSLMDLLKVTTLINGLNGDFETLKDILLVNEAMEFEACAAKVIETAERLKGEDLRSKSSYEEEHSTAAFAVYNKPDTCQYCNRAGHSEESCWVKNPDLNPHQKGNNMKEKADMRRERSKVGIKSVNTRKISSWGGDDSW